jgi:hypothetical protein|tara:strand:- start:524 stop:1282 length:759 start_codon:yes stop_codon:yes gene_type:complete
MASIDDIVEDKQEVANDIDSSANTNNLEAKVESGSMLGLAAKSLFAGGLVAATYPIVGVSSLLTFFGNMAGYIIEKKKAKEEINSHELVKEAGTGAVLGTVGHGLYSLIDIIPNYDWTMKVVKTLAFNPLMLAPYTAFYQTFTYLRDKVGLWKSAAGMFNLKIVDYLKEAYQNEVKPNFFNAMKKVMMLSPIHFASINYVTDIWKRVGIGVGNDIAFRLFNKKEKETQIDQFPAPAYSQADPYRRQEQPLAA